MTPKEQFLKLLDDTLFNIDRIDKDTPWSITEPTWWLEMMELRRKTFDIKSKYKESK